MACNLFIFTILGGLSESSKITLFKDFNLEIAKFKVTEIRKKGVIFRDFSLKYLFDKTFK